MGCLLILRLALGAVADDSWCVLYDAGFQLDNVAAWTSPLTSSEKTPEGLRISDPSTDGGSGRFYRADWHADPQAGATVETRLKVVSCSAPWGVVLLVSDGRPGNWLAFSLDEGNTWTGHLCFCEGQTTSYNSVEEVDLQVEDGV